MYLPPFKLERYFAQYEFAVKYLLSSSDCDGMAQQRLLSLADDETRALWDNLTLGYTESRGLPQLREEIAALYSRKSADHVLVVTPEEGIYLTLITHLNPGDHIICTYPGYQSLYVIAASLGCTVTKWLPDENKGWRFDPEFLESAIQANTRMLVINFPHNPTGSVPSRADFERMIEIANAHDLIVFSDEMYYLLEVEEEDWLPSAANLYGNTISLFGMSKTFGLAGLRIGWLVSGIPYLLTRIAQMKDYTTICSSAPSEILALMALRARQTIVAENRALIAANLRLLDDFFARRANLMTWNRPKAGTIGFPRLRDGLSAEQFCKMVVEEAGIMLLPSTVYDYDDQHLRLGFGRKNLPEVLAAFDAYLDEKQV
ncbi:MAG: aminotransferase class I/II-fold pyridoxal phosphate-dependent enzyme [Chloroflexi bacterium]|nr:aminotransferase class I/II-fold pyridoxal phosphate-dependent enzyme [Chloroflexota bacterium]